MTASYIQDIEALAAGFSDRDVTLYFPDFESEPTEESLNRVFGPPVGIDDKTWPIYRKLDALLEIAGDEWDGTDIRMEHVFTIDLRGIEAPWAPDGARAMLLFIANAGYNEAWQSGTDQTEVIFLDQAMVERGLYKGSLPRKRDHQSRRFSLVEVRVPAAVFGPDVDDTSPLGMLHKAIWKAPARLGGPPIWLQGDPDEDMFGDYDDYGEAMDEDDGEPAHPDVPDPQPVGLRGTGRFCMQFDEGFADVNLGDCGVMYVFGYEAYFQCY